MNIEKAETLCVYLQYEGIIVEDLNSFFNMPQGQVTLNIAASLLEKLGTRMYQQVFKKQPKPEDLEGWWKSNFDADDAQVALKGWANQMVRGYATMVTDSGLDGPSAQQVAEYVKVVVSRIELTQERLDDFNADPDTAKGYLVTLTPDAELAAFDEPQRRLISRVLQALARPLYRVAFNLPDSLQELHRSQNRISEQLAVELARIQATLRPIAEVAQRIDPERNLAIFEAEYRKSLVGELDWMELLGLERINPKVVEYPLKSTFVHLKVSGGARTHIEQALIRHRHLLLYGTAGSGKTTLIRWLGLSAAEQSFGPAASQLNDLLPIMITLRDYANKPPPAALSDLLGSALTLPSVPKDVLHEFVRQRLADGRALVLIDGVDEVSGHLGVEEGIRDWVSRLVREFPRAYYIISSRPIADAANWLSLKGARYDPNLHFMEATVADLDDGELEELVRLWHSAAKDLLDDPEMPRRGEEMLAEVHGSSALRRLAATPLLAAALCALRMNPPYKLPERRKELYEGMIRMLLEKRDAARGLERSVASLNYDQKYRLLETIAERMEATSIEHGDLVKVLENRISLMNRDVNVGDIAKFFIERSGLLRQVDEGRYEFIHRTFQEFLVAGYHVREGDLEEIGYYIGTASEVPYFMFAQSIDCSPLVSRWLRKLEIETSPKEKIKILGELAVCISAAVELRPDVADGVAKAYRALERRMPPDIRQGISLLLTVKIDPSLFEEEEENPETPSLPQPKLGRRKK